MEIKSGTNRFFIGDSENNPKAEITYTHQNEGVIVADHTYVSEELRGQGVAGQLFNQLIAFARENNYKIIPQCSYVKTKMEKTNEYDDVLAK